MRLRNGFKGVPAGVLGFGILLAQGAWGQNFTITTVAGDGDFNIPTGPVNGISATGIDIEDPGGVAIDGAGNQIVASGCWLFKVTPAGLIYTILGGQQPCGYSGDGGPAASAAVNIPRDVALDSSGNIYFADFLNGRVRKVSTTGIITTVAGGGSALNGSADGIPATQAYLSTVYGIALDSANNLYIADGMSRIRKVTTDGIIHTLAGTGFPGFSGDGGAATSAKLFGPTGVGVDLSGNVYIVDSLSYRIRKVSTNGVINTIAGNGSGSFSGDGGPATSAGMGPTGNIRIDSAGNIYFPDTNSQRIRVITTDGIINTIAGNGSVGFSGDGGPATSAQLDNPLAVGLAADGTVYVADLLNSRIRKLAGSSIGGGGQLPTGPFTFVPLTPCRVLDTRVAAGAFGGPKMAANSTRSFNLPSSACGIPASATAYSLNVTVVPDTVLGYLSIWPTGQAQPLVSTLNSDGRVKANAAIVPAGINGGIDIFVSHATQAIVDIDGYFVATGGLEFYPLAPCRVADTRGAANALGGPFLSAGQSRSFPVLLSGCNVPASAQAYSMNFTVVPHTALGYLAAWPSGQPQPLASILNAPTASVTANAAIVPAGASGAVTAYASSDSDLIMDINGYFAAAGGGLNLYTVAPCRVLDTRTVGAGSPFSGTLPVGVSSSGCGAPASAQAFVLNATVIPVGVLGFLSLWPAGDSQPLVSTLNADPATVTSNMAIVPASLGSVDAYGSQATHLILDISSYFAP